MIGSFSSGQLQDWLGRRFVFGLASVIAIAGIAVNFVAATPSVFLAGKMVTGLAIGLILSGAQTYVSEITPLPMRGIALSIYTISLVSGSFCISVTVFEAWMNANGMSIESWNVNRHIVNIQPDRHYGSLCI
jgi:MFS family permease